MTISYLLLTARLLKNDFDSVAAIPKSVQTITKHSLQFCDYLAISEIFQHFPNYGVGLTNSRKDSATTIYKLIC